MATQDNISGIGKKLQGIYAIVNLVNGMRYVGSSVNIAGRYKGHCLELNKSKHVNRHLQFAWNKYGQKSFRLTIVEIVDDKKEIFNREQFYLDTWDNLYNAAKIAGKPPTELCQTPEAQLKRRLAITGLKRSPEYCASVSARQLGKKRGPLSQQTKERIRIGMTGKVFGPRSKEACENISAALRNRKPPSKETKRKIGDFFRGKPKSEESKQKNRESHLGVPMSEECYAKMRPIWDSEEFANKIRARKLGIPRSEETKAKISQSRKGIIQTEASIQKGNISRETNRQRKRDLGIPLITKFKLGQIEGMSTCAYIRKLSSEGCTKDEIRLQLNSRGITPNEGTLNTNYRAGVKLRKDIAA